MSAKRRNEVIDGFRGIGIATVIAYHFCFAWQNELGLEPGSPWLQLGSLGVQIFFVVSGLVITMTLLRSRDAINFAIRRAARLIPVFWVAGTLIFVTLKLYDPLHFAPTARDWLASLTFMPFELRQDYVDGAFWSLNIEIKFYVLAALSYAALRQQFWVGLIGFALLGAVAHQVTDAGQRIVFLGPYMPFFLVGLALWFSFYDPNRLAAWICSGVATFLYVLQVPFYTLPDLPAWLPHIYLALMIGALILLIAFAPETPTGPLAWLGRCSYSVYLIHQRLGVTLIAALLAAGLNPSLAIAIAALAAIATGWLLYRLIELPGQAVLLNMFDFRLRDPAPHVLPEEPVPPAASDQVLATANGLARFELICLWGRKRGSRTAKGATPSNTDKGVRELKAIGYRTHDVDASAIAARLPAILPEKILTALTFALGAIQLLQLARDPSRVIYTSNHPWVRVAAQLKRAGLIRNRLVIRWTANDIDYAALGRHGPVRHQAERMMSEVDACFVISARERDLWCNAFPVLAERFVFWPTPVDVDFYRARRNTADGTRRERVVAVGSDYKRDWNLPLAMASAGVPVTILTEDPQVPPLVERAAAPDCELLFRIGLAASAEVLADAGAILLATLENDRFSGSTTVGVAAALGRPLMIDEPYDLAAYGLADGVNCVTFRRGDAEDAITRARGLLADPMERKRLGFAIEPLTDPLSVAAYVIALEAAFRPGWRASQVAWPPSD